MRCRGRATPGVTGCRTSFRLGDLFLTVKVDEVRSDGIAETWTTPSDAKLRTTLVALEPGFNALPGWTLTPPEFSPYLLAAGGLRRGLAIPDQPRRVEQSTVPLRATIEGEEGRGGRRRALSRRQAGAAGPVAGARRAARGRRHDRACGLVWRRPSSGRRSTRCPPASAPRCARRRPSS
jgi:hypothetical protein